VLEESEFTDVRHGPGGAGAGGASQKDGGRGKKKKIILQRQSKDFLR